MNEKYIGSRFDNFLDEYAILEESTATAIKRVLAWQIAEGMKQQNLTEADMAEKMHTDRAALNRLLDEEDTSLTLTTLANAAAVLGKMVRIELITPLDS
ncbi:MAG: XRE family transcriptional regulator [Candidatus Methylumidiphilus sp.]